MKRFILTLVLFTVSNIIHASIATSIEPEVIHLGESFRLNITLIDETTETTPDILALQNDFTIDGTEHRVSYTIINGDAHNFSQWTILLTPKRAGKIIIPPIHIGQVQTQQTQVRIEGETKKSTTYTHVPINAPIQMNTKAHEKNPYINQQILYSVKLYTRVPLLNANYEPPHLEEALMISLGNREYQTMQQGQTYTVEEQRYAFFPQKSGPQTIDPPSFKALMYGSPPQQANVAGTPADLVVKPMPKSSTGQHWLPAKSITLSESYHFSKKSNAVGDTVTRIITLQGIAIPAELLALEPTQSTRAYSVYPEKPTLNNTIHGEDVMGTTTYKLSYLFNKSGKVTLPGVSITWFNTKTQQEEKTQLPPKIMFIHNKKGSTEPAHNTKQRAKTIATHPYGIISLSLLIAGLFIGYVIKRYIKANTPLKTLQIACKGNNARAAEQALLLWARTQWPGHIFLNLNDILKLLKDKALIEAIRQLSETLYGKTIQVWSGETLLASLGYYRKQHTQTKKKNNRLPDINPHNS